MAGTGDGTLNIAALGPAEGLGAYTLGGVGIPHAVVAAVGLAAVNALPSRAAGTRLIHTEAVLAVTARDWADPNAAVLAAEPVGTATEARLPVAHTVAGALLRARALGAVLPQKPTAAYAFLVLVANAMATAVEGALGNRAILSSPLWLTCTNAGPAASMASALVGAELSGTITSSKAWFAHALQVLAHPVPTAVLRATQLVLAGRPTPTEFTGTGGIHLTHTVAGAVPPNARAIGTGAVVPSPSGVAGTHAATALPMATAIARAQLHRAASAAPPVDAVTHSIYAFPTATALPFRLAIAGATLLRTIQATPPRGANTGGVGTHSPP